MSADAWDLVVIGGGITGAAVFREGVRAGLKTLLLERNDFASGTSSRSSKLVHGGLRYLSQGRFGLVKESVRERARLLAEAPGLVEPLGFLLPTYRGKRPRPAELAFGLALYDILGGTWAHEFLRPEEVARRAPHLSLDGLTGAFAYGDASTDDARLVLRLVLEGIAAGGTAWNHTRVTGLLREKDLVAGVRIEDGARRTEIGARAVVNATGASADILRGAVGAPPRIRRLRGSHLVFPAWRLPAAQAITLMHPADGRYLFVIPWGPVTVFGTTDLDETGGDGDETAISPEEVSYLEAALAARLPSLALSASDAIASYCGVRPVIGSGKAKPSQESREHALFDEEGLLTVTGGKLTTFRPTARQALERLAPRLPPMRLIAPEAPIFDAAAETPALAGLPRAPRRRLVGRYGAAADAVVSAAAPGELDAVPGTDILWAELRHGARAEHVRHLDDLLLRRVRLGLVTKDGGARFLPRVRALCQAELAWDDARWESEESRYRALVLREHGVPS